MFLRVPEKKLILKLQLMIKRERDPKVVEAYKQLIELLKQQKGRREK
jgi:hypothetical protein